MRLPLDAQQPVTNPASPFLRIYHFNLTFLLKFIILKHTGTDETECLCAFSTKHWDT